MSLQLVTSASIGMLYLDKKNKPNTDNPIYRPEDDLFDEDGLMKVRGRSIHVEEAENTVPQKLTEFNLKREQLHEAQLFHGSSSASLIAFTSYNEREGALLPLGLLEKSKKIPFSGEIVDGRTGVNATCLSTTWIGGLEGALRYTSSKGWNPEIGKQRIENADTILIEDCNEIQEIDYLDNKLKEELRNELVNAIATGNFDSYKEVSNRIDNILLELNSNPYAGTNAKRAVNSREINFRRMVEWERLNDTERELVSKPFPILYGIKSTRRDSHGAVDSPIFGEISLRGGAQRGEIKVVFVPPSKVDFVRTLFAINGHSNIDIEVLPEKQAR